MLSKNEIKYLRSLQLKKNRDEERLILIEGERIVHEILERHPDQVVRVFSTVDQAAIDENFEVIRIDQRTLEQLTRSKSPQALLALVRYPEFTSVDSELTLVLDGIQDPGNLGTILRTAAWFGVKQLVCSTHSADVCNPKVVQSSMGAIYDISIIYTDLTTYLKAKNQPIYGALLNGANVQQTKFEKPCLLVMGNEGNGISAEVQKHITHPVTILKFGLGESLNVATATGILLFEMGR